VGVHPRAVITEERLRHKRDRLVVLSRDVPHDVFVILHVVAHRLERRETNIDFGLSSRGHLVMLALDRDAGFLKFQAHLVADVLQRVGGRDRKITLLRPDLVTEVGKLLPLAVPMSFAAVDRVERAVSREAETHVVENEKLRFRPEESGVGYASALQISLLFFCDATRVPVVRLARNRFDDRADEAQGRLGVENIDPCRCRIGNDEHVGSIDRFPATDARTVEAEAFREDLLVIFRERRGEMLPGTGQIGKFEIHEFDLVVFDHLADIGWGLFVGHG